MSFINYYEVLNVSMHATLFEIKKAYRRKAQIYHPDINANDVNSTEHFQKIQVAYETLSKPEKRKIYDLQLLKSDVPLSFNKNENTNTASILKQSETLLHFLKVQHVKNINSEALADFLLSLLSESSTQIIVETATFEEREKLCRNILQACKSIISAKLFVQISKRIVEIIPNTNIELKADLERELAKRNQNELMNRIVPLAALGIILFFILAMSLILARAKK